MAPTTHRTSCWVAPGDVRFGRGRHRLETLLGSCVAITLWHNRHRIGGMCHYMVPSRGCPTSHATELDGRYADEAVALLQRHIERSGTSAGEYEVNIFGAGNQFGCDTPTSGIDVPKQNIDIGLGLLDRHGFTLRGVHLGGSGSRRVTLDLATGEVRLRHRQLPSAGGGR